MTNNEQTLGFCTKPKLRDLKKIEETFCPFCENPIYMGSSLPDMDFIKSWIERYGTFRRVGGRVGNKSICSECVGELQTLCASG